MTTVGTTNIKFSNLKTGYNNNEGNITTTQISLSSFRNATFAPISFPSSFGTFIPSTGAISIESHFKDKTFTPYIISYTAHNWETPSTATPTGTSSWKLYSTNELDNSEGTFEITIRGGGSGSKAWVGSVMSSELTYDKGYIYIDGVEQWVGHGTSSTNPSGYSWGYYSTPISRTADKTIKFKYTKDQNTKAGDDRQECLFYVN
jgi:hypothetical protein